MANHENSPKILTDQSTSTGVNRDGKNMFSWIKWIIECNLPFTFVDYSITRSLFLTSYLTSLA